MRSWHRSQGWVLGWLFTLSGAGLLRLLGVGGSMAQLRPADLLLGPAVVVYFVCLDAERRRRRRDEDAEFEAEIADWRAAHRRTAAVPA